MGKRLKSSGIQKDGLMKRAIEIFKKSSENEKRKKEIKIREKKSRPKGYRAKRFGAMTFWMLFLFMLLIVFVNVFSSDGISSVTDDSMAGKNKATSPEGIEFAKSFVVTYFNWDIENEKRSERIGRLGTYLPEKLSEKILIDSKKWNSMTTRENIVLMDVEDLEDEKSRITFRARVIFENTVLEKKAESEVAPKPKKVKTAKYISVPVYYDEVENRFIVYDLPSFSYVDEQEARKSIDSETNGLKTATSVSNQNINAFLETFFEAYANDPKDKLTYIVTDPIHQSGLSKTMDFVRLKNTEIFEGKSINENVVQTEVVLADPETGIEFASSYVLVLLEQDKRYTVLHINNKKYIDELKNKQKEGSAQQDVSDDQKPLNKEIEQNDSVK
ncbi:conjugal transfer protein [Sporosarcina soli]|uniref:Conjugal transfer protein n=1 Tax=Sporosarcina soli TaxID=334736 RepID=A0ABW0TS48_9BACL